MSLNLQKLKSIKGTTTMLVFGYIREIQSRYFQHDKKHNTYYDIPPLIRYICLSYTQIEYRLYKDFNLKQDLIRAILLYGFSTKPSRIHQLCIPPILAKQNVFCQTLASTHKIATYTIAALQAIDLNEPQCQVLVLSNIYTQFLYVKIIKSFSKYLPVTFKVFKDAASVRNYNDLQFVVAHPNAATELISRDMLNLKTLKLFILDGADELFLFGHKQKINECGKFISSEQMTQIIIFSSTIPKEVLQFVEKIVRNPFKIFHKPEAEFTLNETRQYFVAVEKEDYKLATLFDLYESITIGQVIIFCNTMRKVKWLCDKMEKGDFTVSILDNGMSSEETEQTIKEFTTGAKRVLIATNYLFSSRKEMNMVNTSFIVNYDLPVIKENYIHTLGNVNRMYNRIRLVINFVTDDDGDMLCDIEKFYRTQIAELPIEIDSILDY